MSYKKINNPFVLARTVFMQKVAALILCVAFLMTSGCGKQNTGLEDTEVFTAPFYVFVDDQNPTIPTIEECGYLLFSNTGNPGLFHHNFVWAENLPKKYQKYLLPVIVTYRIKERENHRTDEGYVETCCTNPIIHIIKINNNNNP